MAAHSTALVASGAEIGARVEIGPFAVIESGAIIGDDVRVGSHVVIHGSARVGCEVSIGAHCLIGTDPESLTFDLRTPTQVTIGANARILERVIVSRSTCDQPTSVGMNCYVMARSFIAHDCRVEDGAILGNGCGLAGHVRVGEKAVIGGQAGVHQWVRIGKGAMVGGQAAAMQDVLPFFMATGNPARHWQLNTVGLRRSGVSSDELAALRGHFLALQSGVEPADSATPHTAAVAAFLAAPSKRGIAPFARQRRRTMEVPA